MDLLSSLLLTHPLPWICQPPTPTSNMRQSGGEGGQEEDLGCRTERKRGA